MIRYLLLLLVWGFIGFGAFKFLNFAYDASRMDPQAKATQSKPIQSKNASPITIPK